MTKSNLQNLRECVTEAYPGFCIAELMLIIFVLFTFFLFAGVLFIFEKFAEPSGVLDLEDFDLRLWVEA